MADQTKIEWTDATWNPITGCSIVSPGCTNCYAMALAGTRLKNHDSRKGLTKQVKGKHVWTGEVRFNAQWLDQPLRWSKPRMIFVCAHGDLFAEGVPDEWLDQIFAVMALCPQHTFQVLTKRPERMREYLRGDENASNDEAHQPHQRILDAAYNIIGSPGRFSPIALHLRSLCEASEPPLPLPNVWLGVSVEDQRRADERRHSMAELAAKGWTTWVSYEPALGPVDWRGWGFLKWLVSGGESGSDARPSHPDWHRGARDFCAVAGVPFLFKQWGEFHPTQIPRSEFAVPRPFHRAGELCANANGRLEGFPQDQDNITVMRRVGKRGAGRLLDGIEHNAFPEIR